MGLDRQPMPLPKSGPWRPTTPFAARLAAFRRLAQNSLDRAPSRDPFEVRVPITLKLTIDDLATLLPPAEHRLLEHIRARKPLDELIGTTGFHSVSRLNRRLQTLLSRISVYCGSVARHRLMGVYDRPGHGHRRRRGRPRKLRRRDQFPEFRLWIPRWLAAKTGLRIIRVSKDYWPGP